MTNSITIAVIEDELPIRKFLRASLVCEGYRVLEADSAESGIRLITQERPDAVMLDLGLPDRDGIAVIKEVRQWSPVPIIILSARGQENDKVIALDTGADDYLTKPFGVGELLARLRAALRTAARLSAGESASGTTYRCGNILVDLATRRVFVDDKEVKLTKIEFDLLKLFAINAGKVLTHRFLLAEIWGAQSVHESHYLRVFMSNLRKKLERNPARPKYLLTEQGVGYRLQSE
jgi:two-component system KDP operon response regulator KdpE